MERKRVSIVLNTLTNSLKQEKELMTEEMKNLQIQYDNTGKSFVWKIKESVEIVAYECGIFENVLREYSNKIQQVSFEKLLSNENLLQTFFTENLNFI